MELTDIRNAFENGRLEAKSAASGKLPHSLWETYSAFANTNGGTIVLGVEEDSDHQLRITGVPHAHELVTTFWNNANDGNTVSANILVDENVRVESHGGMDVIIIDIPRAPREMRPVFAGRNPLTGTYRRNGEGDYHCSQDEYRAMVRDQGDEPIDGTVIGEIGLESIDISTLNAYRNMLKAQRPGHPWLELPDDELLWKLGAAQRVPGSRQLHPTRAGLLMFGDERYITGEFTHYLLDFRLITDTSARRWDDRIMSADGTWPGNVFGFWTRVTPKLMDGLPMPFNLPNGIVRLDDTPLRKAVREAFTNALGHADYFGGTGVVVLRYGNERIDFRNPGSLRLEQSLIERGGLSDARNPGIMKMFNLLGIGERAGSGFDTLRAGARSENLSEPTLLEELHPDRVTLSMPITASSAQPHRIGKAPALTGREAAVMGLFADRPSLTTADIAQATGLSRPRVRALLGKLMQKGLLDQHGQARATFYTKTSN
ncbi:RNA-binding domain-containing protein [Bifidobacterium avesanii]|uniref:Helix-turn-helix domain-containing protein n=1 Tax=Bifidobacterium avesanii TaxID=1798157 RepID=A0A7K3TJW1_9BIFI|nr:RNA-binding domain-containing protein [Bifidobacterium avesanii]KAB8288522.1 transcriptional regulator [Bifidobacterium avesanii]NEG79246.1 helix-turn-helix domain-containing protein [Bifidobacterium avesanii]